MNYKRVYDPIYGDIEIQDDLLKIIDTIIFKRLKNIKQLGLTHHVFPSALHTRFEHSIGTMHLSNLMINKLNQNSNYKINKKNRLLINIAALCHDIGHGPFSHLFDKITNSNHENRSCDIIEYLLPKTKLKLNGYDLDIIKNCINPSDKNKKKLIYNIVANKNTELDVDKFDYIQRDTYFTGLKFNTNYSRLMNQVMVIDDKLCYPLKLKDEILDFFYTRYSLYKNIYNHKTTRSIDYMVIDILKNSKDFIKFNNIQEFLKLNDNILENIYNFNKTSTITKKLYERIYKRDLYTFLGEINNLSEIYSTSHVLEYILDNSPIEKDKLIVETLNIGISKTNEFPLKNINFYNKKNKIINLDVKNITKLIPSILKENTIRIFYKDKKNIKIIQFIKKRIHELNQF